MASVKKITWVYLLIFLVVALWSGYHPFETGLWFLEAGLCVVGLIVLIATFKRFEFTTLTYTFILIHFTILFIGAHYSYSRVPLFDWIGEIFEHTRNNYDKIGHFAQGFIPAMVAREIIIRQEVVRKTSWIPFIVVCIALAISAFYEFIEWWVAVLSGTGAEDFLGTQGYEWDTQSDMLCAMLGAITMLILFSRIQDKAMRKLMNSKKDKNEI